MQCRASVDSCVLSSSVANALRQGLYSTLVPFIFKVSLLVLHSSRMECVRKITPILKSSDRTQLINNYRPIS